MFKEIFTKALLNEKRDEDITVVLDGYIFMWDGETITMKDKKGKVIDTMDAPSLSSERMKKMININK